MDLTLTNSIHPVYHITEEMTRLLFLHNAIDLDSTPIIFLAIEEVFITGAEHAAVVSNSAKERSSTGSAQRHGGHHISLP